MVLGFMAFSVLISNKLFSLPEQGDRQMRIKRGEDDVQSFAISSLYRVYFYRLATYNGYQKGIR